MSRLLLHGLALGLVFLVTPPAKAADFTYYAPPSAPGPWQTVNAYTSSTAVTITFRPLGSTRVFGEVRFFDEGGNQVVLPLLSGIPFRVGDGLTPVEVRFWGMPFGSGVVGTISP